jgi:septal ring factor EnvC (AmiA/AmiB activator)
MENEEYRSRLRQLERDMAERIDTTNHVEQSVGEFKTHLEDLRYQLQDKENENDSLRQQLNVLEGNFLVLHDSDVTSIFN